MWSVTEGKVHLIFGFEGIRGETGWGLVRERSRGGEVGGMGGRPRTCGNRPRVESQVLDENKGTRKEACVGGDVKR